MEHLKPWQVQVAASIAGSTRDLGPVATAHGIKRTGPARMAGQHLSLAPNDPALSEEELQQADVQRAQHKAARFHERNDAAAMALQLQQWRADGVL